MHLLDKKLVVVVWRSTELHCFDSSCETTQQESIIDRASKRIDERKFLESMNVTDSK